MKTCDEMVNSLLERREQYAAEQKRKKTMVTRAAASMCCICLVAFMGIDIWTGGLFDAAPSGQTSEDALYPGIKDNFNESIGESPDNPAANNKIVINAMGSVSKDKMNICLLSEDFVAMTREEMAAYYGVDYVPAVPKDMKPWEEEQSGIYRRNGGTGEVYWDADILNYSSEDFTRTVHVEVDKGNDLLPDYFFFEGSEEESVINNIKILIGLSKDGCYYTEFMYHGVGFHMNAEGVTEDEFVGIIRSIVEG